MTATPKSLRYTTNRPELRLHYQVANILKEHTTWQFTHMAHGEKRERSVAAKLKRMGLKPGWPDFILLSPKGSPHFLELKSLTGALSPHQREFMEWCHAHEVVYEIARTQKQAIDILMEWGCLNVQDY